MQGVRVNGGGGKSFQIVPKGKKKNSDRQHMGFGLLASALERLMADVVVLARRPWLHHKGLTETDTTIGNGKGSSSSTSMKCENTAAWC